MDDKNYNDEMTFNQEEELDSKTKAIVWCVLIGILLVVAFFTNPSAERHQEKVDEIVNKFERSHSSRTANFAIRAEAPEGLRHVEYHSLGVLSLTTFVDGRNSEFATIGAFGYVHPLFKLGIIGIK